MNSKNNKTSDFHRLLLNLSDKINLKRSSKNLSGKYSQKDRAISLGLRTGLE